jgi:replicative DNA helicase
VLDTGLTEDDFYRDRHRVVFAAIRSLHGAGRPIDYLTVVDQLERESTLELAGGREAVDGLAGYAPAAGNAAEYARIVRDLAQVRALLTATHQIQAQLFERRHTGEELIDEAERLIFGLRAKSLAARQRLLEDAVAEEIERLEQAARGTREIPGLRTGLPELDRLMGGLQDGRLYVIAARPAMGKSLLTLQIARHAAFVERGRVLFASLEMSDSETAQRHLTAESGVDPERLHLGQVKDGDWPSLLKVASETAGRPFHLLDDGDLSLFVLRAQARQTAVRHGDLRLVVVDCLQLMRAEKPSGSRVEDVSGFSRGLKRLARELRCPVIAVAQLSRAVEQRPDKRPVLPDLRESGQIEGDADCVLMLYRDDYYDRDSRAAGGDGHHRPQEPAGTARPDQPPDGQPAPLSAALTASPSTTSDLPARELAQRCLLLLRVAGERQGKERCQAQGGRGQSPQATQRELQRDRVQRGGHDDRLERSAARALNGCAATPWRTPQEEHAEIHYGPCRGRRRR